MAAGQQLVPIQFLVACLYLFTGLLQPPSGSPTEAIRAPLPCLREVLPGVVRETSVLWNTLLLPVGALCPVSLDLLGALAPVSLGPWHAVSLWGWVGGGHAVWFNLVGSSLPFISWAVLPVCRQQTPCTGKPALLKAQCVQRLEGTAGAVPGCGRLSGSSALSPAGVPVCQMAVQTVVQPVHKGLSENMVPLHY